MRHIVTLSLVFFSLTHLAKAERIEGLRIITEKYCNGPQTDKEQVCIRSNQPDSPEHPLFLSYSQLTLIGLVPEISIAKYRVDNQAIANLTTRGKPKNNSP